MSIMKHTAIWQWKIRPLAVIAPFASAGADRDGIDVGGYSGFR
tara:strand:- start:475 stop:603 length:129 start_codon:yes stop_codon:yes gene_type:complete